MASRSKLLVGVALPALASGFLLAREAAMTPAFAAACNGAVNTATSTTCTGGSTGQVLTYVGSNGAYNEGNFELTLDGHAVTDGGIVFSGTVADTNGNLGDGNGKIVLRNGSSVTNTGGDAINVSADAGTEDITVEVRSGSSVTGDAEGIEIDAATGGGVSITTDADTTVAGTNGHGIQATAQGNVNMTIGGSVNGGNSGIDTLSVIGSVFITTGDDARISGTDSNGIVASAGTNGIVSITTGRRSTAIGGAADGILATNNNPGTVAVTLGDEAVANGGDDGIDATTNSGDLTIQTGQGSRAEGRGIPVDPNDPNPPDGNGIEAKSLSGTIRIATGTGSSATGDDFGITASTGSGGAIAILNNGNILGGQAGLAALNQVGAIQITNNGSIANSSALATDLAIRTAGGGAVIGNAGRITGRIETGNIADRLDNDGTWVTGGASNFGDGADTANNNATLTVGLNNAAAETANLVGLETLNNAGKIILADQLGGGGGNVSDRLTTSGNYVGQGAGALLHVDASLGGPGSLSDVLAVGGNTSGVTRILVNDINLGPGAFNPTGILVVDVTGTANAGDFVLLNGPIDKGLFVYDLVFNNVDQANDQFLLVSSADEEVFETLATVASSQEIWRETANAWEGRQQTLRDRLADRVLVTAVADPPLTSEPEAESSLWFQALGSWTERNARVSGFNLDYDQSIYGFVAGVDVDVSLGDDSTVLLGVLGGYVESTLDFDQTSTSIKTDGVTLGAYASFLHRGFFANVLVKADVLDLDYSAPSLIDDAHDDTDAVSLGGRADIGFRFGNTVFVEPMLSLDAISTRIDEFTVGGADIDPGTNDSIRGGAGLRLGVDADIVTASVTTRVWEVFDNDNEVDIAAGGVLAISDDTLEGTYGEVAGQIDLNLSSSTVLFARGSYLFSDDISKPSVSGGFTFLW